MSPYSTSLSWRGHLKFLERHYGILAARERVDFSLSEVAGQKLAAWPYRLPYEEGGRGEDMGIFIQRQMVAFGFQHPTRPFVPSWEVAQERILAFVLHFYALAAREQRKAMAPFIGKMIHGQRKGDRGLVRGAFRGMRAQLSKEVPEALIRQALGEGPPKVCGPMARSLALP